MRDPTILKNAGTYKGRWILWLRGGFGERSRGLCGPCGWAEPGNVTQGWEEEARVPGRQVSVRLMMPLALGCLPRSEGPRLTKGMGGAQEGRC